MASYMVNVYVDLIKKGKKTIDQVPEKLRADVQAELDKLNAPVEEEEANA